MVVSRKNGKAWESVGREVEAMYRAWLVGSGMSEEEMLRRVNGGAFHVSCARDAEHVLVTLHDEDGEIGMGFVWVSDGGIPFENYRLDLSLVLAAIRERTESENSRREIKRFILGELS